MDSNNKKSNISKISYSKQDIGAFERISNMIMQLSDS